MATRRHPAWRPEPLIAIAAASACGLLPCRASADVSGTQLSLMVGDLIGNYDVSSLQQNVNIPTTIDGTYEIFQASKRSIFVRATMSYDFSNAELMYAYIGSGFNFYLGGGMEFDQGDEHDQVTYVPTRRYFIGPDYGISEVVLKQISSALSVSGGMFELGGHVGFIQSIGKNLGIEGLLGFSYGMGFTQVSASGTTARIFLGLTQYF